MTSNPTTNQQFSGDGSLKNITLVLRSFDGSKRVNITSLLSTLVIYEDIFQSTMFGELSIIDSIDLMNGSLQLDEGVRFPIVGEEFLEVYYEITESDDIRPARKLEFFVYKISNIKINQTNTTRTYTLHLCSKENLTDSITSVQQAYKDSISNIVTAVCKDYLNIQDDTNGKFKKVLNPDYLEVTMGDQNIIIPALSPLEALQFLSRRAVALSTPTAPLFQSGSYLFFENMNGFNFCDVEFLILQGKKKHDRNGLHNYTYHIEDPKVNNEEPRNFKTVIDMVQKHKFDTIEKLKLGYFETQTLTYDFINHNVVPTTWDFKDNYSKLNVLGNPEANTSNQGLAFPENSEAFIDFATTQASAANSSSNASPSTVDTSNKSFKRFLIPKDLSQGFPDTHLDSIYANRLAYFTRLNQQMITVNVIGDPLIVAGDVINLNLPEATGLDEKRSGEGLDKLTSGYYLVGSIQHRFTLTTYGTSIDLYKNAYGALVNQNDNTQIIPASSPFIEDQFQYPYEVLKTNQTVVDKIFGF